MDKSEIEILIKIAQDNLLNEYFGRDFALEDSPENRAFLEKLNIKYRKTNWDELLILYYGEMQKIIDAIEDNKETIEEYLKTKEKSIISVFAFMFGENLSDNFLESIIESKEPGIEQYQKRRMVFYVEDDNYLKKLVEHYRDYRLDSDDVSSILIRLNDSEYTKKIIEEKSIDLPSCSIIQLLLTVIKDIDYIKKVIENYNDYNLYIDDVFTLLKKLNDFELTRTILEKGNISESEKRPLILLCARQDEDYLKMVIGKRKEYNFSGEEIARLINDSEVADKSELFRLMDKETSQVFREKFADIDCIKKYLEIFIERENVSINIDEILKLAELSEGVFRTNFNICDNRYVSVLGEEKIALISYYPWIVNKILDLSDSELTIFSKVLEKYQQMSGEEEWTPIANRVLEHIGDYRELIESMNSSEDFDIGKIIPILIHKNSFGIKTIDDIENFGEIKRRKCEELMQSDSIEEKRRAVILKIFGQDLEEVESIISRFGEDIGEIEDEDLKSYVRSLQEILSVEDEETLGEIFRKVNEIDGINSVLVERKLKNAYWKLYQKDLFRLEEAKRIKQEEGVTLYSAGIDFRIILTSIGSYRMDNSAIKNYKEDWNRNDNSTQHFCASYIRNDMLGHLIGPHIYFGFEQLEDDTLMLSGPTDIKSSVHAFETISLYEKYLSPTNQIIRTEDYNEMDFRRVQGGKKKQPDYIVVFRENDKIDNIEEAIKASKDFSGLPIVVIDVDECLASEREKVKGLLEQYRKTGDSKIKEAIEEKLRNNRVTDVSFCSDMGIDEFLRDAPKKDEEVSMGDLEGLYEEVTSSERQEESNRLGSIYATIMEIKMEGNKNGERE